MCVPGNASSSSEIDCDSDNLLCDSDESVSDNLNDRRSSGEHRADPINQNSNIFENLKEVADELHLFDPLCAFSDGTLIELLAKLTRLNKTGIISATALGKIIELVFWALPKPNVCPPNKETYFEIVKKMSLPEEKQVVTFACSNCMGSFEEPRLNQMCLTCKSDTTSLWVKNDVETTLKNMLEFRGLAGLIETGNFKRQKSKQDGVISDVGDGLIAKSIKRDSIYDLCLVHNTDSFNFTNSKSLQIWTNVLSFTDIPPAMRSKFTILASVWFSPDKPAFIEHMTAFAMEMQKLALVGFSWVHPVTKCEITSKVFVVASTMDAQVRAPVLYMNQSNETYGCSFCEIQGERISVDNGHFCLYPFSKTTIQNQNGTDVLRTRDSVEEQADIIMGDDDESKKKLVAGIPIPKSIKGVQGYSSLLGLPKFDIVNSFSPDVLHSCFLGVVQRWTKLIFDPKNNSEPYYVGNVIETVNDKLMLMQIPFCVSRAPRSVKDLSLWEASEFRNWLFYFSLPCLHKLLPAKFLDHHILLVQAIYNLCKSEIKPNDLKEAKYLLIKYCSEFAKLYGASEETFDLHLLLHYGSSVENIGPLWANSTFLFASTNDAMQKSMPGTLEMSLEMINSAKIHNALSAMDHIAAINFAKNEDEIIMLGAPVPINNIENIDVVVKLSSIARKHKVKATSLQVHERVRFKGVDYSVAAKYSSPYVSVKSKHPGNPSVVLKALYFVYVSRSVQFVIGNHVNLSGARFITKCGRFFVNHLQKFTVAQRIVHENIALIECPMFRSLNLLSKPPNNLDLQLL